MQFGRIVDLDLEAGRGILSTNSAVWPFELSAVVEGEDRFLIVRDFSLKREIHVSFFLGIGGVVNSVVVRPGLICDRPSFSSDPPMFDMRFGSGDSHLVNPVDIPVLLVDTRSDLNAAMDAIALEAKCVGLEVLPGLTLQKSPVLSICVGSGIFVIELSLLSVAERTIFACFLYGLHACVHKQIAFASSEEDPFHRLIQIYPNLFQTPFPTTNVLTKPQSLADLVDDMFGYRMEPVGQLRDNLSFGCHFGRGAFHARQVYGARPTETAPPMRRMRKAPHPLAMGPSAFPLPRRVPDEATSSNSHRINEAMYMPHMPDLAQRMRGATKHMPEPIALRTFSMPASNVAEQPTEAPDENSTLMADLIERLKSSKRKAISPPPDSNEENAKQFLQWFENQPRE